MTDRAPTELADGLAGPRTPASGGPFGSRYGRRRLCAWRPIRPGRERSFAPRHWVPRSPPHRAEAIRQVDFLTRAGLQVPPRPYVNFITPPEACKNPCCGQR
jgi:hypothetical protein